MDRCLAIHLVVLHTLHQVLLVLLLCEGEVAVLTSLHLQVSFLVAVFLVDLE